MQSLQSTPQSPETLQHISNTSHQRENPSPLSHDEMVSLRELSFLHSREFKIQSGQIGDQGSNITYNNLLCQIEEGLREQFSEVGMVRTQNNQTWTFQGYVKRIMNKDRLTVGELKGFLHSHLVEQSKMELFQELMCAEQKDNETPQQLRCESLDLNR